MIPFVMAGTTNRGIVGNIGNAVRVFPSQSLTIDIFGNTFYRDTVIGKGLANKYDFGHKLRASQSYEKETEGINHLLNQLKEAHYQTALTRLHLGVHVETLKTAQKQFEKVYKERLAEQGSQTPSQIKEIRQQLQELHEFYVDFTAITAYAYPDRTAYASLRDQLNTIRDRYKKLQPTKKTNKTAAMSSENGTV